jgi:hypothetical protein
MAINLEKNERNKAKLIEVAAKQELLALNRKHQVEQQILEIQIKSNKASLERSKIEQEVAKVKLAAEVKVAEAEAKRIIADKTKTEEEKEAALAMVEAKKFSLKAQQYEDVLLKQREQQQISDEQIQRFNLRNKQKGERQDKEIAYASSTKTQSDDKAILKALKNDLKPLQEELKGINLKDNSRLSSIFTRENNTPNLNTNNTTQSFEQFLNTFSKDTVSQNRVAANKAIENINKKLDKGNLSIKQEENLEKQKDKIIQSQTQLVRDDSLIELITPFFNAFDKQKDISAINKTQEKVSSSPVFNIEIKNDIKLTGENIKTDYAKELEKITTNTMYNVIKKVNVELGKN